MIHLTKINLLISSLVLIPIISGLILFNTHESEARKQSTLEAYVQADYTFLAPKVSGIIKEVLVKDYQSVQAGDLLATIDDVDFVIAHRQAKAQVASMVATIEGLQAQLTQQALVIRQAVAVVEATNATLALAELEGVRYQLVANTGSGSIQNWQQAATKVKIEQANLSKAQTAHESTQQQVEILNAELKKAQANHEQALSQLATATQNLSYTRIIAPVNGVVDQRSLRVGAYVGIGTNLLAIVPLDALYVYANYRETQLANIRTGDPVTITVDALPGIALQGVVDDLSPASGVTYSVIAPRNATGNFTKIVQRLPIRIRFMEDQPALSQLKVGMSVKPTILTNPDSK